MKVLYYHQYFSTPDGAVGTRSYEVAQELLRAGHQVEMVCLSDPLRTKTGLTSAFTKGVRTGYVNGIYVIEFKLSYTNNDSFLRRTLIFLRYSWLSTLVALRSDADLIFATTTPLTVGIPGIAARWLRGTPFVFEVRDLWPELPKAMKVINNPLVLASLSCLEWFSYYSADNCIGLAPGICEGISKRGVDRDCITCIPNGCDLEIFRPLDASEYKRPQLIDGLPATLPPDAFVVAFTGAHGLANGLDAVLDAAEELQKRCRLDIHFLFIGDGRSKPKLIRRAEREKLDNCHFLPLLPKRQLAAILRQSVHVGLMVLDDVPAFYQGTSPNKFFDYLACGLPVVNNYPGWLAKMISDYKLGVPVSPRDAVAFAEALIHLADRPDLVRSMGKNSRSLAESDYSRRFLVAKSREVIEATGIALANRNKAYVAKKAYDVIKEIADRLLALTGLVLLSPLLVMIYLLIRWKLGSPVLFMQQRSGFHERPFLLLKFRTMNNNLNSNGKLLPDSERLSALGWLLRSTSIDELPTLINILQGQMSFVGPRPLLMQYLPHYSQEQARRHHVKPGLSGWAQVNGRNAISWAQKFRYDVWYVDHQSFLLDLKILFMTFVIVIKRRGINSTDGNSMPIFLGNDKKGGA